MLLLGTIGIFYLSYLTRSCSPWETEVDPEIRAQLRLLDMKTATFGERHPGTGVTLSKLGGLCREAGRLEVGERRVLVEYDSLWP